MATYIERSQNRYDRKIRELLPLLPPYLGDFYHYLSCTGNYSPKKDIPQKRPRTPQTCYTYLFDIVSLHNHLLSTLSDLKDVTLKALPIRYITGLSADDISEYLDSLEVTDDNGNTQKISDNYLRRKMSVLTTFFDFMVSYHKMPLNPMDNLSTVPRETYTKGLKVLTESQVKALLQGVLDNELYLFEMKSETDKRSVIQPIDERSQIRRERQALRNYAILSLQLYHGMTVSEVCSLNVDALNDRTLTFERRTGEKGEITLCPEALKAMQLYIDGMEIPGYLMEEIPSFDAVYAFLMDNLTLPRESLSNEVKREFGRSDPEFIDRCLELASYARRSGRKAFHPTDAEKAMFLSATNKTASHRLSQRMVQHMNQLMTKTYLPDLCHSENLTQTTFRSTYINRSINSKERAFYDDLGLSKKHYMRRKASGIDKAIPD